MERWELFDIKSWWIGKYGMEPASQGRRVLKKGCLEMQTRTGRILSPQILGGAIFQIQIQSVLWSVEITMWTHSLFLVCWFPRLDRGSTLLKWHSVSSWLLVNTNNILTEWTEFQKNQVCCVTWSKRWIRAWNLPTSRWRSPIVTRIKSKVTLFMQLYHKLHQHCFTKW